MNETVKPIVWDGHELQLLDQRRLPVETLHVTCRNPEDVAEAIRSMVVRGAPAIGVCAAFGMALAANLNQADLSSQSKSIREAANLLRHTRPTAVNLGWAIDRMLRKLGELSSGSAIEASAVAEGLHAEAEAIFREDLEANHRIGRYGNELLAEETTVLTHCNAGALATAGYGTALGVVRAAHDSGKKIAVFANETRPFLQGARLTAWELQHDGIDVTLITDSMAGHFFQKRTFDAVIVGADRIAANGDTANKIGTYTLAVLARTHAVPFYVAAPMSTFDVTCPSGASIPIEERRSEEVTETSGFDSKGQRHTIRIAPDGVLARHPAFDVTPADLITAIITDQGVLRSPYDAAIRSAMSQQARHPEAENDPRTAFANNEPGSSS